MSDSPSLKALAKVVDDVELVEIIRGRLAAVVPVVHTTKTDAAANLILLHVVDQLARVFPRISLELEDRGQEVSATKIGTQANSAIEFIDAEPGGPRIHLRDPAPEAFFVDASGWRLHVASPHQVHELIGPEADANPASALLASALVVARLLASIPNLLDEPSPGEATRINLWDPSDRTDGPAIPDVIDLDVHVMGYGSLSHAALAGLRLWSNLTGSIVAIDHDTYDDHNPARYMHVSESLVGESKVLAFKSDEERHSGLRVLPVASTLQAWRKEPEMVPRLALISPDNREARAWAADSLPASAVSATAGHQEARVHLCSPETGICAYCMYAPPLEDQQHVQNSIADFAGLSIVETRRLTNEMRGRPGAPPMNAQHIATIETHMRKPPGSLTHWIGKTIFDFLHVHRVQWYSSAALKVTGEDPCHLPIPVVSAAGGALMLAGMLHFMYGNPGAIGFNCIDVNVFTGAKSFRTERRPTSRTCLCQHPFRISWRQAGE